MLYYLFQFLDKQYDLPGAGVFQYISFRSGLAVIVAIIISAVFGRSIIRMLQKNQMGEVIRTLGLKGEESKAGTPTMGGLIIIAAILIPTLLFTDVLNIYILIMLLVTVWMGAIGFIDDYIKVVKKDKKGLAGKFKILGQVFLGLIVGVIIYTNDDIVLRQEFDQHVQDQIKEGVTVKRLEIETEDGQKREVYEVKGLLTTIPFFKDNEFDYTKLLSFLGENAYKYAYLLFIPIVIFVITAVSNGANITDGLDGLATGTSAIIMATLAVFTYVSGNIIFSEYLNIMYIPKSAELVIFCASFIGASVGFLWYNSFPAQVFMGDTGSLTIGGIIATLAILIRKELLLPILCGVFLIENLSVMMQVGYFKYTKKKYGEGRRIFKMAPLHHHFQKKGYHETKIVTRFWLVGLLLALITVLTLKLR